MSVHPHPGSEGPENPNPQQRELRAIASPALTPIERYLQSPEVTGLTEGGGKIEALYVLFDSEDIVHDARAIVAETFRRKEDNILRQLLQPEATEGLTSVELIELYESNPLIQTCMRQSQVKHADGDLEAARAYRLVFQLSMHLVRYEWLNGKYDEIDPIWYSRASRLGVFRGSEKHVHIAPGYDRETRVPQPRRRTPSDILPDNPLTP